MIRVLPVGLLAACGAPPPVSATAADGVSLGLFASDALYDYGSLVEEIDGLGADALLLVVPVDLADSTASVPRLGVPLPTLQRTLRQAHAAGLSVSVMPVIDLGARAHAGDWRGRLAPSEPERFWAAYGAALDRIAVAAEAGGATRLVVGSELSSLESDSDRWEAVIAQARTRFGGRLTYSANWDHHREVPFWDALDEVGVSAYHPVDAGPDRAWTDALEAARATADGQPLVITEYGYPALASAAERPWDETTGATSDEALQARLYEAAHRALGCAAPAATFAWNWFGLEADPASPFSPRGRPAAAVLREHFATDPSQRCPSERT